MHLHSRSSRQNASHDKQSLVAYVMGVIEYREVQKKHSAGCGFLVRFGDNPIVELGSPRNLVKQSSISHPMIGEATRRNRTTNPFLFCTRR